MKNAKKTFVLLVLLAALVAALQGWNDEKMFTAISGGAGKYNVILIQDHSGSMVETLYHPDFDPNSTVYDDSLTMPTLRTTSWVIRWVSGTTIRSQYGRGVINNWNSSTNTLTLRTGYGVDTNIKAGDWILQYRDYDGTMGDDAVEFDIQYQMVAQVVTKTAQNSGSYRYTYLELDPSTIQGTPTLNYYVGYYRYSSYTPRIVKLYGTNKDLGQNGVSYGSYNNGPAKYGRWLFAYANDAQRQQVTDFSTLAYDVDYNGYLRPTPVSPANAYALNPDNSNKSETLLAEWNRVMKAMYPNKIAYLANSITSTATTIAYEKAKESFANYLTPGFLIKIDAETMLVTAHTPDSENEGCGSLTVTRAQNNTSAASHASLAAVMIYNNESLGIDEYAPLNHLFSSTQHVVESTGDVDTSWTETKIVNGTNKTCWRYKRVFTRIQTAREAICDVVTAKNMLAAVGDLAAAAADSDSELVYCNANPDFVDRVAPFYIKVIDPDNPGSDEVMLVTAHDSATYTLAVTRGQNGTSACAHPMYSKIMVYSGARDMVRFGFFVFPETDSQGSESNYDVTARLLPNSSGTYVGGLNDYGLKNSDGTYHTDSYINTRVLDNIDRLTASGMTPLAKALTQVWNYLKPNNNSYDASNPYNCYIRQTSTGWEAVDENTFGANEKFEEINGVTHPKGSPMEYWCQKNFAVLITDGDATADDDFTSSYRGVFSQASTKTANAGNVVSDFFKFDYNRSSGPTPYGDTISGGITSYDGEYLPDTAYFLSHQDMFPTKMIKSGTWSTTDKIYISGTPEADGDLFNETDTNPYKQWPDNQNINTYTVGLCIANPVLEKAAKNGGGVNFTAFNYKDLSDAFQTIVTSVSLLSEPMTYTTYAAPKQSITGDTYGYVAHFVPQERAVWQGHLRRFLLDDDGNFPGDIDDPNAQVIVNGQPHTSFQWDALTKLADRDDAGILRTVYTAKKVSGNWERLDFMGGGITYSDLDVTLGQVDQVKKFTQNMVNADDSPISEYVGSKLGETFHFNPQLVGYPLKWKASFDSSYAMFYERYSDENNPATELVPDPRKEVVYAGANDGKVHCFQASDGEELWGFVPFYQLKRLKEPALNPLVATKHTYFNDGKAVVKDIKISSSHTGEEAWMDWRTGLFFGMGIGGRSYCALDVTDPDDPQVLWEFSDGYDASDNPDGRMGFTESKPIVVDMNGGALGTFPAAILAGGYNEPEVAIDTPLPYQEWQKKEGKSLYVLDARDGTLVKKFLAGTGTDSTDLTYIPGLKCALTAAPTVFDSNNDGIADYMYVAETGDYVIANNQGGRIWKINCFGNPLNWTAQLIYQAPAGQTIFIPPTLAYDNDYRVWVMFGTGRRSQAAFGTGGVFSNLTGQFVAFIDDNSGTTIDNSQLQNVTSDIQSPGEHSYELKDSGGSTIARGFYFNFFMDTNEIMFEPSPLYVNMYVYFMTFSPHEGEGSSGTSDDPCGGSSSVGGMHYIYFFKLSSQGNAFTIGEVIAQSGKILGYGPMDDKWKPYFGDGEAGNFKPNPTPPVELTNIFGPLLWKEDKQ
ncbi:MAG: hypothetical protein JXO51_04515 [Candidatus Aminicenantes bacterium]|nr:hypothetical protein [Candidatus Aminicenantes bacterium]